MQFNNVQFTEQAAKPKHLEKLNELKEFRPTLKQTISKTSEKKIIETKFSRDNRKNHFILAFYFHFDPV